MEPIRFEELIGCKLTAIDPCYMTEDETEPTLTVGKGYEVIDFHEGLNAIVVTDDDNQEHMFEVKHNGKFVPYKCSLTGKTVTAFNELDINYMY